MNRKNIYLYLYLVSWTLIVIIWLRFLVVTLNSEIKYGDTRVGFVVPLTGISLLLSFLPSIHILLSSYWYIKKWRNKNNLIYILICILILMTSMVWSSKHITHSIEKSERLYVPPAPYQP